MLRVVVPGANKLLLFARTFLSGGMREMIIVSALVYCSFLFAIMIVMPADGFRRSAMHLYRTLILGDGEQFDSIGLTANDGEAAETGFGILGTALFNIVIMNVFIAIYTTQYAQLENDAELLFQRERARFACRYVLQHQKLQLLGFPEPERRPWAWRLLTLLVPLAFVVGVALLLTPRSPLCSCAAAFIAFSQVLWQAILMRSKWLPCRAACAYCPSHETKHFLWVCHRTEMPEVFASSAAAYSLGANRMPSDQVERMDAKIEAVERKMDRLADNVNLILDRLQNVSAPPIQAGR